MCHVKVIQKTDDLQDLDEDEYCKYLHDTMSATINATATALHAGQSTTRG